MNSSETLTQIKNSFETWYNATHPKKSHVSIVINYSDMQTLLIKAYHTIKMEVAAIMIEDNKPVSTSLITIQENYNHGILSEQEAKDHLTERLLVEMYGYNK